MTFPNAADVILYIYNFSTFYGRLRVVLCTFLQTSLFQPFHHIFITFFGCKCVCFAILSDIKGCIMYQVWLGHLNLCGSSKAFVSQDAPNFGRTNKAGHDGQSGHSGNTWICESERVGFKFNKNPEANRFETLDVRF